MSDSELSSEVSHNNVGKQASHVFRACSAWFLILLILLNIDNRLNILTQKRLVTFT